MLGSELASAGFMILNKVFRGAGIHELSLASCQEFTGMLCLHGLSLELLAKKACVTLVAGRVLFSPRKEGLYLI